MDWDDPEKRIAELERQQADANASAGQLPSQPVTGGPMSTARGELTADGVHNMAFSTPPRGKRGYDEGEVEAFLRRLEEHLRNPQAVGGLTAAEDIPEGNLKRHADTERPPARPDRSRRRPVRLVR